MERGNRCVGQKAERRPVHDTDTIRAMLKNADVILTARLDGPVVCVSRAITDFAYCTYSSHLPVDERHRRQGIGSLVRFGQRSPSRY